MTKKIFYLSTCVTCQKVLKALEPLEGIVLQDVKESPITASQLEELKKIVGSYAALFSKRARLYTQQNLKEKTLSENDYKDLILGHYTFLKRPIIVVADAIFIGNSQKEVTKAKEALHR
ncbi:ArsC/Spx/MgsR family protein [Arenibacter sp. GZD96]|uniref:arsenate reductase family protein n=1 Tax=Aurantibrevibacter litoralis TaxID=3106030 RepID=UPI002AFED640|nr:ArsC/Spx/MgsR family protein [Arenibacter sp. GZD-96]MEA1785621.1 ArsC/Spx/MgsR family protein [Arenibacter sp. GZD-96]